MVKKNDGFFAEKREWSKVKDDLLACYLEPYVQKILYTRKSLLYVDCFAGKGKFDSGEEGSPIIALKIFKNCLLKSKLQSLPKIETVFIDKNYAADLKKNLQSYPGAKIISGKYEEMIDGIINNKESWNVFLYIDPYGVMCLPYSKFENFAKHKFNSIELLINFNSFGFIREGCRALGTSFKEEKDFFDDLVEPEQVGESINADLKSVKNLNAIAGGSYWQKIIKDYKDGKIDCYKAEDLLSKKYCNRLLKDFTYVLNLPIRIRVGQHSKYRMIHVTNHPDGCLLMVDNINTRLKYLQRIQSQGSMSLFEENVNNNFVDSDDIKLRVESHFSECKEFTSLSRAIAEFFVKNGVICSKSLVIKILREYEKNGYLIIEREPKTSNTGKPSIFMEEGKGKKVNIKWKGL